MSPWWLGAIVLGLPCLAPTGAAAQVAGSVAIDSDDRLRGVSLSDGRPTLSLSLSYDHPSGVFAGVTGVAVETRHAGPRPLGYVAYLGYAGRLASGGTWDVGVTNGQATVRADRIYSANYSELYAGFTNGDLSAHIYYSPDYLNEASTIYVDLNSSIRLSSRWRLFGHVGMLNSLRPPSPYEGGRARFDLRAGIAREFKRSELRLAWTTTAPAPYFPPGDRQRRNALVLGAAFFF
jgi:uncharacterized protein (TIGR02001 family)